MIIVIAGPPGAGKGTVAKRLAAEFGMRHLSTGDMLRRAVRGSNPYHAEIKASLGTGALLSDDIIISLLEGQDLSNVILDGFPRTIVQAEALQKIENFYTFDITVPDDVLIDRISKRLTCAGCGNTYHETFRLPARCGYCDDCGSPLFRRPDDTAEIIELRLAEYREKTYTLNQFYKKCGGWWLHNGNQHPDVVYAEVAAEISCLKVLKSVEKEIDEIDSPCSQEIVEEFFDECFSRFEGEEDDILPAANHWLSYLEKLNVSDLPSAEVLANRWLSDNA